MIQVWHDKKPTFGRTTREFNEENFEKVATIETEDLEKAFAAPNSITTPWSNIYRSTSVGDVMVRRVSGVEVKLRVARTGYEQILSPEETRAAEELIEEAKQQAEERERCTCYCGHWDCGGSCGECHRCTGGEHQLVSPYCLYPEFYPGDERGTVN